MIETNYPCAHCEFGTYMNVEEHWWCSKHNMYDCEMEGNRGLCEKFKTTSEDDAISRKAALDLATVVETDDDSGIEFRERRMTRKEQNNKLKHLITCMKCEVSGKCCDENCPTQYYAGNMGEIIENLEEISKILERLDSYIEDAKSEGDFSYIKPFEDAWMPLPEPYKAETEGEE